MVWALLARIWRLQRALREEVAPGLARLGLSGLDPWLLSVLRAHPHPMGAARAMGLPPPTVSHMLRRLEAEGFLRRSLDPKDLRRYRLELTPKGEAALREAERLLEGALARRLARLSEEEQALLARLLSRLEGEA
ncbi:Transcriptional regulator SlyA [Thermus aquaticus]|uniref:Transcriptional regulator SlyA n=1 Tax=Thermus aquaticus TaxID=271 RepID=A0A0M9AH67_THEAQ|nr:MarR family transcriptional regulator [Thermus aquaticus]KOX90621.1 Transcriptional regulator SlyA [Thermus aquaticus]